MENRDPKNQAKTKLYIHSCLTIMLLHVSEGVHNELRSPVLQYKLKFPTFWDEDTTVCTVCSVGGDYGRVQFCGKQQRN